MEHRELGEELKNYGRRDEDAFQLIPEEVAGAIAGVILAALVIADVLWHLRQHFGP